MDFALHSECFDAFFLPDVCGVTVELLSGIIFVDQRFQFLRVMDCRIRHHIGSDELGTLIYLEVIFVAVEVHLVLFRPSGITVFLAQFVWLCRP